MIQAKEFLNHLEKNDINFFAGVPDSLMKGFLSQLENLPGHFITANEGAALAMAAGYHLATGKTGLVYLQNSGLGNLINPLTSLADKEVYSIPMLLLIGWRGQPGKKDEPQHKKMGAVTKALLDTLEVPYFLFSENDGEWKTQVGNAATKARMEQRPVALIVEENFFADNNVVPGNNYELSAEAVMQHCLPFLGDQHLIVATTGKMGRLFYALNQKRQTPLKKYFLNVGAMGHASSVAAALAKYSGSHIVLLDGDGSLLMHAGSLAVISQLQLPNLTWLLFNNGSHQSVGGQKTVGFDVDFCAMAKACGFIKTMLVTSKTELSEINFLNGGEFVEIRINTQMPDSLPRPQESFTEAKQDLMKQLKSDLI